MFAEHDTFHLLKPILSHLFGSLSLRMRKLKRGEVKWQVQDYPINFSTLKTTIKFPPLSA